MSSSESENEEISNDIQESENENEVTATFESLGLHPDLCEAAKKLGWRAPTKIQKEAIPPALEGHDIIGLAETGSGKTGAFALPILHALLESPSRLFALVLTPTRELAYQIAEQFDKLGRDIKLKTACLVGKLFEIIYDRMYMIMLL